MDQDVQPTNISPETKQEFLVHVEGLLNQMKAMVTKHIKQILASDTAEMFDLQAKGAKTGAHEAVLGMLTFILEGIYKRQGIGLLQFSLQGADTMSPEFNALANIIHQEITINGREAVETILLLPGVCEVLAEAYDEEISVHLLTHPDNDDVEEQENA